MSSTESSLIFHAKVFVYEDGTLSITDSDIRGLIIEVGSFHDLFTELRYVASDLLELNHGLSDQQIGESRLLLNSSLSQILINEKNSYPNLLYQKYFWLIKNICILFGMHRLWLDMSEKLFNYSRRVDFL